MKPKGQIVGGETLVILGVWGLSGPEGRFNCQDLMAVPFGDMDQVLVLL